MGASTAHHLSNGPGRTLVLERFYENHPFGSSHGRTRILRTAYAEGVAYVPLVLRARRLWMRLGREAGEEIFRATGVLLAAPSGSKSLASAQSSARRYRLRHELLDPERAQERFPAFRFARDDAAFWDPGGGVLFPERAIRAYRRLAHARGVRFRWDSPVVRWRPLSGGRIVVSTATREYLAHSLVLSAGAWLPTLVVALRLPLEVEQQTVYWFRARDRTRGSYRTMPAFVWYGPQGGYHYGTPDVGDGVKIGGNEGQRVRNLARRPPPSSRELRSVQRFLTDRLPGLSSEPRRQVRCLYTNTTDKNFIVDFHPDHPNIVVVSACSGHGFKFASVMGELIAQGVRTGRLAPVLASFCLPKTR
ncbi:MAG: N-methyl-L-tryptophan oxidase [Thermoplasmata archaeon]|nr:N-methyl-L-tryptophan oxidase [Thermoplasmata archaeon]